MVPRARTIPLQLSGKINRLSSCTWFTATALGNCSSQLDQALVNSTVLFTYAQIETYMTKLISDVDPEPCDEMLVRHQSPTPAARPLDVYRLQRRSEAACLIGWSIHEKLRLLDMPQYCRSQP